MDWLEQLYGLNPDGGSGSVEAALVVSVGLLVAVGALMIRKRTRERLAAVLHRALAKMAERVM